jgi:N-methylhydantoinase A
MAASTILSGLAGGIIGSSYLGRLLGYRNIINTDMGGTSFEVGIIHRGVPLVAVHPLSPRFGIYISRYHLALPMIDITAIGSGGGSIAWLDEGTLKVGPRSAGAHPGPSCYGKGGTEPTVTDADIVLGYLNSEYFLGGRMPLDPNASSEAIRNKIAIPLGIDLTEAAKGIYEVVNNQMADLIRSLTIERGYHPKDFVLFAYGGAGPMHCGSYGNALGVTKMLVPGRGFATAHSAFGVATSDLSKTFSLSDPTAEPFEAQRINRNFSNLEAKALETLATWGVAREEIILRRSVDMRYKKQTHEITIDVSSIEFGQQGVDQLIELFERNYELLFGAGTSHREAGVELITFRVDALGTVGKPSLKLHSLEGPDSGTALKAKRGAYFAEVDDFTETEIFEGSKLRAGNMIHGPAIIEYPGTTVVVHPGQTCTVDEYLNIVLEV